MLIVRRMENGDHENEGVLVSRLLIELCFPISKKNSDTSQYEQSLLPLLPLIQPLHFSFRRLETFLQFLGLMDIGRLYAGAVVNIIVAEL